MSAGLECPIIDTTQATKRKWCIDYRTKTPEKAGKSGLSRIRGAVDGIGVNAPVTAPLPAGKRSGRTDVGEGVSV